MTEPGRPLPHWGIVAVFACGVAAISTGSILVRQAQAIAPSAVAVFYRLAIAALVLVPWALLTARGRARIARADLAWATIAGVFLALHFYTWFRSLEFTSIASSVVLVSASPLVVALLAPLFLDERVTRRTIAGIAIAIIGAAMVAFAGTDATLATHGDHPLLGNALALTGAVMIGGYLVIGRHVRRRVPLVVFVAITYGSAAVTSLVLVFTEGHSLVGYPTPAFQWFALLALLPQLIGHSTLNWALRHLPSATVAVGTLAEPIGAIALAWIIFDELPTLGEAAGAVVLLAGIYVVVTRSRVDATRSASEVR